MNFSENIAFISIQTRKVVISYYYLYNVEKFMLCDLHTHTHNSFDGFPEATAHAMAQAADRKSVV